MRCGCGYDRNGLPQAYDYLVFQDGGYVVAKNGKTGEIDFRDTDAKNLLQEVVNELGSGIILIKQGDYKSSDITTPLSLSRNIQIIGEGYEVTKLNFPVKLADALNKLYGVAIINPNDDKTGIGLLGEQGSGHEIDNVLIQGWEKAFEFASTGAFGNIKIGVLRIKNCKYALAGGTQYQFYWFVDQINVTSCDGFGSFAPQYSHFKAINISSTGSITPSYIAGQATTIDTLFLENNSVLYLSQGGVGGFNGSIINKLYVTSGSKVIFGNVQIPSYVNYLHVSSDSTIETWVNDIYIRAPRGIDGTLSIRANKPYIYGIERSGVETITGDGTTTTFTIDVQHRLNIDDPTKIVVSIDPSKQGRVSYQLVDTDGDGFKETLRITLSFSTAPASGEIIYISWIARVVYA